MAPEKLKFQVGFSFVVAVAALFLTWLILGDGSPIANYLVRHRDLANTWRMTTFLPFLFSAVISRNPHSPPMAIFIVGLFLQWWIIGYLLSIPVAKRCSRGQKK